MLVSQRDNIIEAIKARMRERGLRLGYTNAELDEKLPKWNDAAADYADAVMKQFNGRHPRVLKALERSLEVQSHYARLLNDYDGGERMTFNSAEAWIERLAVVDKEQT